MEFDQFVRPPEAPVFRPSLSEFQNPLKYIEKIREKAELFGICKIIPPPTWKSTFPLDRDTFTFESRIQELNTLEARTRLKVRWMESLKLFWNVLCGSLEIPLVQGKPLDLYALNKLVQDNSGNGAHNKDLKFWAWLGSKLGLAMDRDFGPDSLRSVYNDIILPLNVLLTDLTSLIDEITPSSAQNKESVSDQPKKVKRCWISINSICGSCSQLVLKLKDRVICHLCKKRYHIICVDIPPQDWVPADGKWSCLNCRDEALKKMVDLAKLNYGFVDELKSYSINEFGQEADEFKKKFFEIADPKAVPLDVVENTFWKLVGSPDSNVKVKYGADLHTPDHESDFPTTSTPKISKGQSKKRDIRNLNFDPIENCNWNLKNLPRCDSSLFQFITGEINGMTKPWLYVGMLFSSFCWHVEDHWTFSINYLHWGEPKTWYGIPANHADAFEARMKQIVPELFERQPDILDQLVTLLNPTPLMSGGVKLSRLDQREGEIVVTFPRAYHAGFNQGFNFAEAANFATASWLPHGFKCIESYAEQKRKCAFSHEEMLWNMTQQTPSLEVTMASQVQQQWAEILIQEMQFQNDVSDCGFLTQRLEEVNADDFPSCTTCNTALFFSFLACSCSNEKRACRRHYKALCSCSKSTWTLHFRFTFDEYEKMVNTLANYLHS